MVIIKTAVKNVATDIWVDSPQGPFFTYKRYGDYFIVRYSSKKEGNTRPIRVSPNHIITLYD